MQSTRTTSIRLAFISQMPPAPFEGSPFSLGTLNASIGAVEVGGMISCLLFGIVTIQVYYYYSNFPKDHIGLKIMVAVIWFAELGHSICICHAIYTVTVTSWGSPHLFDVAPVTLSIGILFDGIATLFVQSFLAWRIRTVAKIWLLTILSWLLSLIWAGFAIMSLVEGVGMTSLNQFIGQSKWGISSILALTVVNDILITSSLIWALWRHRNSTTYKSTITVINTLVRWTIQTGLFTSISAFLMMVFFLAMPNNFIWLAVYMFLTKVYSNSLMATLNGRSILRQESNVITLGTVRNFGSETTTSTNMPIESEIGFMNGSKSTTSQATTSDNIPQANIVISREVVTN